MNATKNTVNKNEKVIKEDNKVCAILNTITASIWGFVTGVELYGLLFSGQKLGWDLWFDISMVIVWGSIAIDYFIKYKKEKEAQ